MVSKHSGRVTEKALEYLREVVEDGFAQSSGPQMVGKFEQAFAKRFGVLYGIAHANGTATLHSCLAAAGVKPGDEVITTPLTAAAPSYAILQQGAIPIFADIDERTFNIDPKSIRQKITLRTKAIMPVHLYGLPAAMDEIMKIAEEYNLKVIEDSAECLLGECHGKLAGTIGHFGSFSLQASKHITCGDGGIVISNHEDSAAKVRKFACFGFATLKGGSGRIIPKKIRCDPQAIRHESMGWNYRMSHLQGAVALEQTERMDELVEKRIRIAELYQRAVKGCPWLLPQYTPPGYKNSYWTFVCRFDEKKAGCTWYEFREKFYQLGGDLIYGAWRLTYNEPMFQERRFLGGFFPIDSEIYLGPKPEYKPGLCPVAERTQPMLMQFKTNYMDETFAENMARVLSNAIDEVGRSGK